MSNHVKTKIQAVLLMMVVHLSACSSHTGLQQSQKPQSFIEGLSLDLTKRHEIVLDNGLKVIVKEDSRSPVVMTQIWYKIGAVDEPAGIGGISHLLEHMMFKGTKKVTGDDFNRIVSKFGGSQNAFTSNDYTGYYQYYPAGRLELALELEADRMKNLVLTKKDFTSERQVVMEERRQRTDDVPKALAYEQFRLLAFSKGNQRKPVIGSMTEIENITLTDLQNWYNQWYQPNNATIVIVGDVKPDNAFALVKKYFNNIAVKAVPQRPSIFEPQLQGKRTETIHTNVSVPMLYLSFNVPSLPSSLKKDKTNNDAYALALLSEVLDGGVSARLEKKLIREQKILAQVGTSYDFFNRGDGLFFISATPSKGVSLEKAEQAILAEINQLKNQPILKEEITKAKVGYITGLIYQQDSVSTQARMIGMLNTIGLDDKIMATLPDKIGEIPESELQKVAKKYFVEDNYARMFIKPINKQ